MNHFTTLIKQIKPAKQSKVMKQANDIEVVRILPDGLYRWNEVKEFIPYGREKWRLLVMAGKAPASIKLSSTCVAWRGSDVLEWLADPAGYRQAPPLRDAHQGNLTTTA